MVKSKWLWQNIYQKAIFISHNPSFMAMDKEVNSVFKEVLGRTKPSKDEIDDVRAKLREFLAELKKAAKKKRIGAGVFVGGSYAKDTMIKKDHYDIDIFVRFHKKHAGKDLSDMTERLIKGVKNVQRIHGSRDYFRVKASSSLFMEVIPVMKISNPKEAENITDLSYFHVKYANRKIKNKKLLDEIRIAKAFCYANNCYGAESYISGFSGYGLELLVYHYKSFLNLINNITKIKADDKIIIDTEKYYKNKNQVLLDMNAAKLQSPIILVDPTYRQRNVLSALSYETFEVFRQAAKDFLKNPSVKSFEMKKINFEESKNSAKKKGNEFIMLKAVTDKQEGDIAGSKLLKFYRHLNEEIGKYFEIKDKGFEYSGKKTALYFFSVKSKKEAIKEGPKTKDAKNVNSFKKMHRKTFNKNGRVYAREKLGFSIKDFLDKWEQKNKKIVSDMSIKELRVIG